MKKIKKRKNSKIIVITILFLIGVYFIYTQILNDNDNKISAPTTTQNINFDPPTNRDKADNEEFKKNLGTVEKNPEEKQPPTTNNPIITSWGQNPETQNVEVAAYVPGVYEVDGECTLTLERNGIIASNIAKATPNVSTMSCGFIAIKRDGLSAGTWTARVSYKSGSTSGITDIINIEVK